MTHREHGRRRPLLRLFALFLLLTVPLTACRREAPPEGEGILVSDALGRTVRVAAPPRRVAALLGSFADVWLLSGGTLVAAADDAWEDFDLPLPGAISVGGAHSPSLELLISAAPDLVLASATTAAHVELCEPLEAMGVTVLYFDVLSFEDYLSMLDTCTALTGNRECYEQNGLRLKAEIDDIKTAFSEADLAEGERRVLLLRVSSTTVKAKGSHGTVLGEMLADLGCQNIADGNAGLLEALSPEAILREDPYRIFAVTMGNDSERAERTLRTMIEESPALRSLTAVREGRVHLMDKTLFNMKPNARYAEAYGILYETLTEQ